MFNPYQRYQQYEEQKKLQAERKTLLTDIRQQINKNRELLYYQFREFAKQSCSTMDLYKRGKISGIAAALTDSINSPNGKLNENHVADGVEAQNVGEKNIRIAENIRQAKQDYAQSENIFEEEVFKILGSKDSAFNDWRATGLDKAQCLTPGRKLTSPLNDHFFQRVRANPFVEKEGSYDNGDRTKRILEEIQDLQAKLNQEFSPNLTSNDRAFFKICGNLNSNNENFWQLAFKQRNPGCFASVSDDINLLTFQLIFDLRSKIADVYENVYDINLTSLILACKESGNLIPNVPVNPQNNQIDDGLKRRVADWIVSKVAISHWVDNQTMAPNHRTHKESMLRKKITDNSYQFYFDKNKWCYNTRVCNLINMISDTLHPINQYAKALGDFLQNLQISGLYAKIPSTFRGFMTLHMFMKYAKDELQQDYQNTLHIAQRTFTMFINDYTEEDILRITENFNDKGCVLPQM